jgi:hypothetical protein
MKTVLTVLGIALAGVAAVANANEQGSVYRWVDKDGTPHYQDRPPEGSAEAQALSLRYKLTDGQAVAAANRKKSELASAADLRKQQEAEDKQLAKTEKEQVQAERQQGCESARAKLNKYETAHRLYKPGPDGQRTYLSDAEIDAARAAARRDVDEWCGEE